MLRASCPTCGAPIVFASKGSLGAVCGHCRTVVRRSGVDLSAHGKVGEIREDATPLCIGARGKFKGKEFQLIGRLQLQYLDGTWNEWHAVFVDGSFAWLAEAQGFYSIQRPLLRPLPPINGSAPTSIDRLTPGLRFTMSDTEYVVSNVGQAHCIGGEGELPFATAGGYQLPFVDFVSAGQDVGTIDFSDPEPRLFAGEWVDFEELSLTGLREELPADHPMARIGDAAAEKLGCPSCGASLERKTGLQAKALYCGYCGAGVDLTQEPYTVFARQDWDGFAGMLAPLGAKVRMEGVEFTVLAGLVREAVRWGVRWTELLLHHPKRGYRWFLDADHHYSWVTPLREWPDADPYAATARGVRMRLLESNEVVVRKVVGELYWRVRVDDTVQATDYASPPNMLSAEATSDEVSWSLGRYMPAQEVKEAFGLDTLPARPTTVAAHQPAPQDAYLRSVLKIWAVAAILIGAWALAYHVASEKAVVARETLKAALPGAKVPAGKARDELARQNLRWIGPFEVPKGPTTLEITADVPVNNSWAYLHLALYDQTTAQIQYLGLEVSRYDGDGDTRESIIVPNVAPGTYQLMVEPEGGGWLKTPIVTYSLSIRRGVPLMRWPGIAFLLVSLVPLFALFRKARFEHRRKEDS